MSKPRTIYLGATAWGALNALAQTEGRGFVNWGKRYAELSPGRAVVFSQVYHSLFALGLLTRQGQNDPGTAVLTDRGLAAYLTGKTTPLPPKATSYLDESEHPPFTLFGQPIPQPEGHKWADAWRYRRAKCR